MSARGLKPQKASKGPRARAISGLWFGSVKSLGFLAWSFAARDLFFFFRLVDAHFRNEDVNMHRM